MEDKKVTYPAFLNNKGPVGELMRSADWTDHFLGLPDTWPVSLRINLNFVLYSRSPMMLFWGSRHLCFYNDAFIPVIERINKHPEAIGQEGASVWGEKWRAIKYQMDQVLLAKEMNRDFDYPVSAILNGATEQLDWMYDFSPVIDEFGENTGVLMTCRTNLHSSAAPEVTTGGHGESNDIIEYVNEGFFAINRDWVVTGSNKSAEKILGRKRDEMIGNIIWELYPELRRARTYAELKKAMYKGTTTSFRTYSEDLFKWFEVTISPSEEGIAIFFKDITEHRRFQLINKHTEEISGVAGWELDIATNEVFMTPRAYEIYGIPGSKSFDMDLNKQYFSKKSLKKIDKALSFVIEKKKPYEIELDFHSADGKNKKLKINGFPLIIDGKVRKLYGTLKDVTRQKQKQRERDELIQKLKTAHKIAKLGYWSHDPNADQSDWSEEIYKIWGVTPETFSPTLDNFMETIHPDDREKFQVDFEKAFPDQNYYDNEHRIITPDGSVKWILERITLYRDKNGNPQLMEGIAQDITDKKEQENKILQALKEKEVLLAEIHHRVKNNLAVISGMMQLQAFEEDNEDLRIKLMDSVVRIASMASIHEQLYHSGNFSKIEFSDNLERLVRKIVDTMQSNVPISLKFDVKETVLNVNQAIPFSLIVNEVMTNILKYAFIGREKGGISFKLFERDEIVKLDIKDDGVGLPKDFEKNKKKTLGLRLISILSKQLDASYEYQSSGEGTLFSIQFGKSEVKGTENAYL